MKFKVGDIVKVVVDWSAGAKQGECGKVIGVLGDITVQVEFDEYDARRHNCDEKCELGHGWNCSANILERVNKFRVGDKVRVLDGSCIENYTGGWYEPMKIYVGNVVTITHIQAFQDSGRIGYVGDGSYTFDERGLEPADTENKVGKIPTPENPMPIEEQLGYAIRHSLDSAFDPWRKLGGETAIYFENGSVTKTIPKEDKPMKLTFYTTEGYRIDKSNNTKIPTIATKVDCIFGDLIQSGSATCDKFNYDEREGVLNAVANALFRGKFDREYNRAVKRNKEYELASRTCNYCGKVFDTVEERKAHEDWHIERRKARHERYLLRKRAKEIAFEEQAQKMAKEIQNGDKK